MRTTLTDLRACADTYISIRARAIPNESPTWFRFVPASGNGVSAIVRDSGEHGGRQTVLLLVGTMHEQWLQLAAAISTFSDVIHAQYMNTLGA